MARGPRPRFPTPRAGCRGGMRRGRKSRRMSTSPVPAPAGAYLSVRALSHEFLVEGARVPALAGVSLNVRQGEFLSLIGPSGCGKTTLLKLLGGLLVPTSGDILLDGAPPQAARRTKSIGVVFQDPALLPWRTVTANIRLPLEVNRQRRAGPDPHGLLGLVGLDGFGGYYPHQLSGGMQQRAALARALATDPPLLLMDEPFGALDEITRTELRYELLRISARARKTVVFVTHSIAEAVLLSDRVAVMSRRPGRIRAVVEIDLPRPRDETDEESASFVEYARRLRALLREE
jgi:NitT/TauT family transport system ATP-binding protein